MSWPTVFALFLLGPWIYGAVLAYLMLQIAPRSGVAALLVAAVYTVGITLLVGWYAQRGGRRVSGE